MNNPYCLVDIRAYYFGLLDKGEYGLFNKNGQQEAIVQEVTAEPYYLTWYTAADRSSASYDIHQVKTFSGIDWMHVLGGSPVKNGAISSKQTYHGPNGSIGFPLFPLNLEDGDSGQLTNIGTWDWVNYDPAPQDPKSVPGTTPLQTASGTYTDLSQWTFFGGRFIWRERYTETPDSGGSTQTSDRELHFDVNGVIGFVDRLSAALTAWRR